MGSVPARLFAGTLVSTGLAAGLGMMSGIVLARSLGPALRGEVAAAILWPSLLTVLADLGIGFSLAFMVGKDRSQASVLWTVASVFGAGVGGVVAAVAVVVLPGRLHLSDPRAALIGVGCIPFSVLLGYNAYLLLGAGEVVAHNAIRVGTAALYVTGLLLVWAKGATSIVAYVSAYALAQVGGAAIGQVLLIRRLHIRWRFDLEPLRELLSIGARSQLAALASHATLRLDQVVMSFILSGESLGYYVIGVALASMFGPLFSALAIVVMPLMKPADPRESVLRAAGFVQFGLLAGGLAVTVAAALAPLLIKVFFGARFLPSVRAAQILLFAAVFQGLNSVLGNALRNLGHPGKPAAGEVLGMAATVGLLAVLLPRYGILGAAAASLIAYTLVFLALLRFLAGIAGVPLTELVAPARLLKVANARESPVPSGDQRAE